VHSTVDNSMLLVFRILSYMFCGSIIQFHISFMTCRRLLDGHAGSAIKVLVAIHYSVLDARNGYIRNVVV